MPAMPDTHHPRLEAWVQRLQEEVGTPDAECTLIGHSLGCITILRFLERLPEGAHVGAVILVAGFYEDLGDEYAEIRSFTDHPVNWDAVRSRCSQYTVIHSDDDAAVPVSFAQRLAENLGTPLQLYHGFGHFSGDDGITELPIVLDTISRTDAAIREDDV